MNLDKEKNLTSIYGFRLFKMVITLNLFDKSLIFYVFSYFISRKSVVFVFKVHH